jgi:cytochrome c
MPPRRASRLWALTLPLAGLLAAGAVVAEYLKEEQDRRTRAETLTGGDAGRGRRLFTAYGCGGCHSLTGVPGAHGQIGPPLDGIGSRAILAGRLENRPENLMRWIGEPQTVAPGTAMPNLGVSAQQRRDIAAFLYDRS